MSTTHPTYHHPRPHFISFLSLLALSYFILFNIFALDGNENRGFTSSERERGRGIPTEKWKRFNFLSNFRFSSESYTWMELPFALRYPLMSTKQFNKSKHLKGHSVPPVCPWQFVINVIWCPLYNRLYIRNSFHLYLSPPPSWRPAWV